MPHRRGSIIALIVVVIAIVIVVVVVEIDHDHVAFGLLVGWAYRAWHRR